MPRPSHNGREAADTTVHRDVSSQEPNPPSDGKSNKKLDYARVSVACTRCRKRKMRCEPGPETGGPCMKCLTSKVDCFFEAVDHAPSEVDSPSQSDDAYSSISRSNLDAVVPEMGYSNAFTPNAGHPSATTAHDFAHAPGLYASQQPFSPFAVEPPPRLPYPSSQAYGGPPPRLPNRDIEMRVPVESGFLMDIAAYSRSLAESFPGPTQHQPSPYPGGSLPTGPAYTTSSAPWPPQQVHLLYQPSPEGPPPLPYQSGLPSYALQGVPRRAVTMPTSPTAVAINTHTTAPNAITEPYSTVLPVPQSFENLQHQLPTRSSSQPGAQGNFGRRPSQQQQRYHWNQQ